MSENNRKRCRKSKLVPRDFLEFVEDDLNLQEPAQKKLLLEKIKRDPEDYIPQDPSTHQFSVNVEVEDMDGSVPDEDPSSYMKYLFSLSSGAAKSPEPQNIEYADNSLLLEPKLVIPMQTVEEEKNCIVNVKKIQNMLGLLHKSYAEEKEVILHARNQWGRIFYERCPQEFKKTPLEAHLQAVLIRWKQLIMVSRTKESPFSYKCYVCDNGWWSFNEFATHLKIHPQCKLSIETHQPELNIIAFEGEVPGYKDIDIHGKCLKCAKTYNHHLTYKRQNDGFYYCNYCGERFHLCKSLTKHEGTCPRNPIRVLAISKNGRDFTVNDFSCQVCNTVFMSSPCLNEHMTICHKVRSDEPIVTTHKTCTTCGQVYYAFGFHVCLKKNYNHECGYCSSKFQHKPMLDHHLTMWKDKVRCRICDKFLYRGCMAAEHYALHSEDFVLAHRCLICRKIKVFVSAEAFKAHHNKYHKKTDSRRPKNDLVIMSKMMLEQCMVDAVKRTPKILKKTSSTTSSTSTSMHAKPSTNLTQGEVMPKVRVYVPVCPTQPNPVTSNEPPLENTTIVQDDTPTMRPLKTEPLPISIKQEKEDHIEPSKDIKPDNIQINDVVIKTEKFDNVSVAPPQLLVLEVGPIEPEVGRNLVDVEEKLISKEAEEAVSILETINQDGYEAVINKEVMNNQEFNEETYDPEVNEAVSNLVTNEKEGKYGTKIMEELNEFLDIKPEITIKEERLSDDETTPATQQLTNLLQMSEIEPDISKVIQASTTFAEEVTESSEHSKVFKISQTVLETTVKIKQEIKEEPVDVEPMEEDPISLNVSNESMNVSKDSRQSTSETELTALNLEPEVILKAGYRKRKIYRCNKCNYSGFHREYKNHITNHCNTIIAKKSINSDCDYFCNKCEKGFPSLKKYVLHFEKHEYRYMSCPQCMAGYDSVSKLLTHVNNHIRSQFFLVKLINSCENTDNCNMYECKSCSEMINKENWFVHWEKHLELQQAPQTTSRESPKLGQSGEHALSSKSLEEAIEVLTRQDRNVDSIHDKACVVCCRVFERRNDCKRHIIEHLLQDAYANINEKAFLKCQICSAVHKKQEHYKKHMRDHGHLPIFKCGLCDKTFSDSSNFTKHKKIHNLKAYICDICNKKFQAKISLEKHMQMHMETEPITCTLCEKVFHERSQYKKHYRQSHDKVFTRFRCLVCREKFQTLRDKWDHMWLVHKQRKEDADCPICGASYRKFNDVKRHAMEMHMETEPITCTPCEKVFHERSQYKKHYRQSHDKVFTRFRCLVCREKFQTLRDKWDHMWLVHKQRKEDADCPICGASYRKFNDVKRHAMEVHGRSVTLSSLWNLLSKIRVQDKPQKERNEGGSQIVKTERDSSDDDCLVIEEERETLIVYD